MNSDHLPYCPYCSKKLKYFESWFLHRKGEYLCPKCGYYSKISYTDNFKKFMIFIIVLAAVLAIIFTIIGSVNIFEVIIISVLLLLMYVLIPFFMVLKKTLQNSYLNKLYSDENDEDSDEVEDSNFFNKSKSLEHTNVIKSSQIHQNYRNNIASLKSDDNIDKTRIIDSIK